MGIEMSLKTVILLFMLVVAAFFSIAVMNGLLHGAAEAADLSKIPGLGFLQRNYITSLSSEIQQDGAAKIKWDVQHREDTLAPQVYYANDPAAFSETEMRDIYYSPSDKDFKKNAETEVVLPLKTGVNKIGIAVFDKNNQLLEKKEVAFKIFNQNYLDHFDKDLNDNDCKSKCNIITCKKDELVFTTLPGKNDVLKLKEDELIQIASSFNSKCSTTRTYFGGPGAFTGPYLVVLDSCSSEEIYSSFENALSLKTQQKINAGDTRQYGVIRQELYDSSKTRQCTDSLKLVLEKNEWRQIP